MKFLIAFSVLAALAGSVAAQPKGNPEAARGKVSMCIGCHGIPGYKTSYPEVYRVPLLAGQSEAYLASALNAYKKGDRQHQSMRGVAAGLSDQDIADIAAYYAQQK